MLCEVRKLTDFDDLCYRASQLDQPSSYEKGFVTPQVLHHLSFTAPRAAAEGGCEVYKAVLKGAERWGTLSTLYDPDHAIFSWPNGLPQYRRNNGVEGYRGAAEVWFDQSAGCSTLSSLKIFVCFASVL